MKKLLILLIPLLLVALPVQAASLSDTARLQLISELTLKIQILQAQLQLLLLQPEITAPLVPNVEVPLPAPECPQWWYWKCPESVPHA